MTNRSPRSTRRSSGQGVLTIVGALAAIIAVALLVVIISSVSNQSSQTATQIASIPTVAVLGQGAPIANTANSPAPSATIAPITPTPLPPQPSPTSIIGQAAEVLGATTVPPITATSAPLPPLPFTPLPGRSFYMARLELPGPVQIIDLPIVNSLWDVSKLGHFVGHLDATNWVDPHEGNVVLVAHIQLAATDFGPFVYLNRAKIGDLVYVSDNGQVYTYQVTNITTVNPTDLTVTYMTPQPILTLITCTTWDQTRGIYSQRLVVTAKLVNAPASATT